MTGLTPAAGSGAPHPGKAPVSNIDPFSNAVFADPYPVHASLRALGPAFYLPQYGLCFFDVDFCLIAMLPK